MEMDFALIGRFNVLELFNQAGYRCEGSIGEG